MWSYYNLDFLKQSIRVVEAVEGLTLTQDLKPPFKVEQPIQVIFSVQGGTYL